MKKRGLLYLSILFSGVLALASCNDIASSSKTNSKTALPSATSTPTNTTKTTTKSTKTTVDLMEFSVTVKYQDGYKCSGAKVKFYDMNGNQVTEEISTSNAKATIKLPEDKKYYAVVTNLESGYSFNPFKSILSKDNPNGEIVLVDLSIAKDGDGTNNSPYSISTGYYATKGNNDYYSVKFDTSGTYVLESFTNGSSSKLKFYGNSLSNNPEEVTSGGEISNFKYLFTVSEKDVASDSLFYFSIEAEANSLFNLLNLETGKKKGNKIGDICPSQELETISRNGTKGKFNLADNIGKVTIVNFWATWCTYCVQEMPDFDKIQKEYNGKLDVVAIHQGSSYDSSKTLEFINDAKRNDYDFIWAIGDSSDKYFKTLGGGEGIPMTVIVDENGVVIGRFEGMTTYSELKKLISKYI